MFYSDVILSKRGPLAKVWLAAHAERRLTKVQLLQTDIEQSVSTIIGPNGMPMALRLSGQLLLGVVRIYSRKAKYLLDDCNDALLKLKTAFRSGAIDFTTDLAHAGSHHNVTLPTTHTAHGFGLPDPALEGWDAESSIGGDRSGSIAQSNRYTARPADITLRRYLDPDENSNMSSFGWASGDFFDPDGGQLDSQQGSSPMRASAAVQRRNSQGELVDQNGDPMAEEAAEDSFSVGIGRDAQLANMSRPSLAAGDDMNGFDDFGAGMDTVGGDDFMLPDFGLDAGVNLGLEEFDAQRRSMTPVRQTALALDTLSPRTALKVQQAAEKRVAAAQKVRKQLIDARTQLDDTRRGGAAQHNETDGIVLAGHNFLPHSRTHLQLLEMAADPSTGLLPFYNNHAAAAAAAVAAATGRRQVLSSARFLAPQLSELLTFDASLVVRNKHRAVDDAEDDGPAQKRLRSSSAAAEGRDQEDFGKEIGRRAVATDASRIDLGLGDEITFDDFDGAAMDDATFDVAEDLAATDLTATMADVGPRRSQRKRNTRGEQDFDEENEEGERRRRAFHAPGDLQRLGTPSEGSVVGSAVDTDLTPTPSYPLRAFDTEAGMAAAALSSSQGGATAMGISRNTSRALKVLRAHLPSENAEGAADEQSSSLHFSDVTRNATRRAAAAFFFEVLALGTKDCLRIEQEESYGDIAIQAKPSLWSLDVAQ